MKTIEDRIDELLSEPSRPDCKNYPCEFGHKGGMRTQGRCRCLDGLPANTQRSVARQMRLLHEAAEELRRLRGALEEVANPIAAMQRRADESGGKLQLDGRWAVYLSDDPAYLKGIARDALRSKP